jgi:hypothetical protein
VGHYFYVKKRLLDYGRENIILLNFPKRAVSDILNEFFGFVFEREFALAEEDLI